MDKENKNKLKKGDEKMASVLEKKRSDLKAKLDFISAKSSKLPTKNRMIELDPENSRHREWFENDKYKGK